MTMMWTKRFLVMGALLALAPACGDSGDKGETVTESPDLGKSTEKMLKAADGGDVAIADAGVKLSVPPGALAKDTKITAAVVSKKDLPEASGLAGNVVEFGPDGLEFLKPVSLELDLAGATIPDDATVSLAWLDTKTNEWMDLPGSAMANGKVTAETTHFTTFAIRFIINEDGDLEQTGGMCGGDFKACGGDLEGTWTIESGCADIPTEAIKSLTQCKGTTFALDVDVTGPITFSKGKISGTLNIETNEVLEAPIGTCVGEGECEADPDDQDDAKYAYTIKGANCERKKAETKSQPIDEAYTVSGSTLVITDDKTSVEYCVDGDSLTVRQPFAGNGVVLEWHAKRN